MQFRWWNSFNLLAVILLAIGITGLVAGGKMVFDPGRTPSGYEWAIYLVAGALMLVNGFLPPANPVADPDEDDEAAASPAARKPAPAAKAAAATAAEDA
jgi:hypothetical protein